MPEQAKALPSAGVADEILANAPLRIGVVTLVVRDLDRVARFYQDVIGLAILRQDGRNAILGAGGTALLDLRHEPSARLWSQREAGLFHTAFLLPTRADLGAWLWHMAGRQYPIQGAADHLVSEAIYLTDPEGNGIEVYADRHSATWKHAQGMVVMGTAALDLDELMRAAEQRWSGLPAGSCVGHVHLQTGDLSRASSFYGDLLGFSVMARYPGALFWGSGGYHHQLATNLWNSRGATIRSDLTTGLAEIELVAKGADTIETTKARLRSGNSTILEDVSGVVARDAWGTKFRLALTGTPELQRS